MLVPLFSLFHVLGFPIFYTKYVLPARGNHNYPIFLRKKSTQKKASAATDASRMQGNRQRPSLPGRRQPSTLGAWVLNCCVRNGNRWGHPAIATGFPSGACALKTPGEKMQRTFPESQALGVLVPVRSTPRGASTPGLSTLSSARRLTAFA